MILKTFAILLSLGTTYSTATYAMDQAPEDFSKTLQRVRDERAGRKEALQQMQEKLDAEEKKLRYAILRNIDVLNDLTISAEESKRLLLEFEELKKNTRAAKEPAVEEFDKLFGNN